MTSLRILAAALVALPLSLGAAEAAATKARKAQPKQSAKERLCTPVEAVATGFGKANVTDFANRNLALKIDGAKDQLASRGAKGFKVEERKVACEDYIDFGGSIGREHKCRATARICGQKT
jgi:hypothetical protein